MNIDHLAPATLMQLALYSSPEHPCSYLPDRLAVTQFVDPYQQMNMALYSSLADQGFRRSGRHVYRPRCAPCHACIPSRVPVTEFKPNRSQRRNWRRNQDLTVTIIKAGYHAEHFQLYQRYMNARHPGTDDTGSTPEHYCDFLLSDWGETLMFEFRYNRRLAAVAVVDRLVRGLSAVYTFFEPDLERRGLGTYAVLAEIEEARRLGLSWLYLGYWIPEAEKMRYKCQYQPFEVRLNEEWQRYSL